MQLTASAVGGYRMNKPTSGERKLCKDWLSSLLPRNLPRRLRILRSILFVLRMIRAKRDQPILAINFNNRGVILHREGKQRHQRSRHAAQTSQPPATAARAFSLPPAPL